MNIVYVKLALATVLFITWVGLVVFQVPDATDLIVTIKLALAALGGYHAGDNSSSQPQATAMTGPITSRGP